MHIVLYLAYLIQFIKALEICVAEHKEKCLNGNGTDFLYSPSLDTVLSDLFTFKSNDIQLYLKDNFAAINTSIIIDESLDTLLLMGDLSEGTTIQTDKEGFNIEGGRNIIIKNIKFFRNIQYKNSNGLVLINNKQIEQMAIQFVNCSFYAGEKSNGTLIHAFNINLRIENCNFSNIFSETAFNISSSRMEMLASIVTLSNIKSFLLGSGELSAVTIENCTFRWLNISGNFLKIISANLNVEIRRCYFFNVSATDSSVDFIYFEKEALQFKIEESIIYYCFFPGRFIIALGKNDSISLIKTLVGAISYGTFISSYDSSAVYLLGTHFENFQYSGSLLLATSDSNFTIDTCQFNKFIMNNISKTEPIFNIKDSNSLEIRYSFFGSFKLTNDFLIIGKANNINFFMSIIKDIFDEMIVSSLIFSIINIPEFSSSNTIVIEKCEFKNFRVNFGKVFSIKAQENKFRIDSSLFHSVYYLRDGSFTNVKSEYFTMNLTSIIYISSISSDDFIKIGYKCSLFIKGSLFSNISLQAAQGLIIIERAIDLEIEGSWFQSIKAIGTFLGDKTVGGLLMALEQNTIKISYCAIIEVDANWEALAIFANQENKIILESALFSYKEVQLNLDLPLISVQKQNKISFQGPFEIITNIGGGFMKMDAENELTISTRSNFSIYRSKPFGEAWDFLQVSSFKNKIAFLENNIKFENISSGTFIKLESENELLMYKIKLKARFCSMLLFYSENLNNISLANCSLIFEASANSLIFENSSVFNLVDSEIFSENSKGLPLNQPLMFMSSTKNAWIKNTKIIGFKSKGIFSSCSSVGNITIEDSAFSQNEMIDGESVFLLVNASNILIQGCNFSYNINYMDGLIHIKSKGISKVLNSKFTNNTAKIGHTEAKANYSRSGGIFLDSMSSSGDNSTIVQSEVDIRGNLFEGNQADFGGAIFIKNLEKIEENLAKMKLVNAFNNNEAFVGKDIGTTIYKIIANESRTDRRNVILDPSEYLFELISYDYNGNIYFKMDRTVEISDNKSNIDFRVFNNNNTLLVKLWNLSSSLGYETVDHNNSKLDIYIISDSELGDFLNVDIKVNLRFIVENEKLIETQFMEASGKFQCPSGTYFDQVNFECKLCDVDTMKLKKNVDRYCETCVDNLVRICKQGNDIILREGFYRYKNSSEILRCKNPKACLDSKCTEYYNSSSFLCSRCIDSRGITSDWACIDCSNGLSYFFLVFVTFVQISFKVYSVKKAYKISKNLKKKRRDEEKHKNYTVFNLASTNCCLKILTIHFSFIYSLYSYPFPSLENIKSDSSPSLYYFILENLRFSFECLSKKLGISYPRVYVEMLIQILKPIMIIIILYIYYVGIILRKRMREEKIKKIRKESLYSRADTLRRHSSLFLNNHREKKNFVSTIIVQLLNKHSLEAIGLVTLTLHYEDMFVGFGSVVAFFTSKEEYDERQVRRLLHEPDHFWNDSYNEIYKIVSMVFIIIFGALVPLYIIFRVCYTRSFFPGKNDMEESQYDLNNAVNMKVENYQLFHRYGYFYYPYNKNSYYYEIVYMLKRLVYLVFNIYIIPLISIHIKYEKNIVAFINLEILCLWFFFLVHMFVNPYRKQLKRVNFIETLSSVILLTSFFFSSLFFNDINQNNSSDLMQKRINMMLYMGIYVANLLFLLYSIVFLIINEKYYVLRFFSKFKGYFCRKRSNNQDPVNIFIKRLNGVNKAEQRGFLGGKRNILELNPLAEWEPSTGRTRTQYSKINNQNQMMLKPYLKKIKQLSILISLQKKEMKSLYNKIQTLKKEATVKGSDPGKPQGQETQLQQINCLSVCASKQATHFSVFKIAGEEEDSQEEFFKNGGESNERKENQQHESLERNSQKGATDFCEKEEPKIGSGTNKNDIFQMIEKDITVSIMNKVFGENLDNYFVKVKISLKIELDKLILKEVKAQNLGDIYIKKRKGSLPFTIFQNQTFNFVLYFRYVREQTSFLPEIQMELTFLHEELIFTKSLSNILNALNFIIIQRSQTQLFIPFFLNDKNTYAGWRSFQKTIRADKQALQITDDNFKDALNCCFPELICQEEAYRKIDEQELVDEKGSDGTLTKLLGLRRIAIQNQAILSTDRNSDSSKIHLVLLNVFLFFEITKNDTDLIFIFRDLNFKSSKAVVEESDEEINKLLEKFLDIRLQKLKRKSKCTENEDIFLN